MKQNDLIEILKKYLNKEMRKIVREEIKYSFDKDLRNIVREELELLGDVDFTLNEKRDRSEASITTEDESYESIVPKKQPKIVNNMKFSNDPLLNDILAETAKDYTSISENKGVASEFQTMGGGPMTSKDVVQGAPPNMRPTPPTPTGKKGINDVREILPDDRRGRDIPDFLQNVLTRDYSELTKAMDKPKKGSPGSLPGMPPPMG